MQPAPSNADPSTRSIVAYKKRATASEKYATGPVQCGSIHEIYRRLQEEGYRIGEAALRAWVKNGQIPAVYRGKRALVLYEDVLAFISRPMPPAA